jgi:hypothetical protein
LEFQGQGHILAPQDASEFWSGLLEKDGELDVKRYILMAFRDNVILPVLEKLETLMAQSRLDFEGSEVTDTVVRMLQCTNILAAIQSGDENQKCIEHLGKILRGNWLSKPRTGKDRTGFVPTKQATA